MIVKIIVGLLLAMIGWSFSQQASNNRLEDIENSNLQIQAKTGLKIEYGPNLGSFYTDTLGIKNFYVHITAIITNDTTIPIQLHLALAKEYEFPDFCSDNKFKVFLLPQELTPDTATVYNNIVTGLHNFLNTPLDKSHLTIKSLNAGEYCVVTIGVLAPRSTNCAAVPRAVFSYDNQDMYSTCDRQLNQSISTYPQLEIGVKLEYYYNRKFIAPEDGCSVIPFGQISYPEQ
jgi:hypothetical protein